MKAIGWILIICGIIAIIFSGVSTTFEGIIAALAPIIGGIICLVKAKDND